MAKARSSSRERITGHKASVTWLKVTRSERERTQDELQSRRLARMLEQANKEPAGPCSPYDPDLIHRIRCWVIRYRKLHDTTPPRILINHEDVPNAPEFFYVGETAVPVIGAGGLTA